MLNSTASCMGLLILAVNKRRYLERPSIVIRESASLLRRSLSWRNSSAIVEITSFGGALGRSFGAFLVDYI